ncbi:MAG: phosphoenolpyruvate synthase [Cyclobacteriaceae bacterium]|nr:phosphoenolpyruvate synthase [Cyclobacteriaceae bacterium]
MNYIIPFSKITMKDLPLVGGKNGSLGEMIQNLSQYSIKVPDGFALTSDAFAKFLDSNKLKEPLHTKLNSLELSSMDNLSEIGNYCRDIVSKATLPTEVKTELQLAYQKIVSTYGEEATFAVRSSGVAEDSPEASFAGQHDSFLNVEGIEQLYLAVMGCYTSLYNDRAIKYRIDNGFQHDQVGLSVGIQLMVRSDKGSAGVAFTIEPENGNKNLIYITGAWGLGESVVQGAVNTDEFYLLKPLLDQNRKSLVYKTMGTKQQMVVYNELGSTDWQQTPFHLRDQYVLTPKEIEQLGNWCNQIEKHYKMPMDIEWAKDGLTNQLFIVQARPETIHTKQKSLTLKEYVLKTDAEPIVSGKAVGRSIVSGRVTIVESLADGKKVKQGDIIVADITNPDWNALLKKAVCIVTNKGGRTSHASIVARELGIPALVGTLYATQKLKDNQLITVSCVSGDEGLVYDGELEWQVKEVSLEHLKNTKVEPMLILADPKKALLHSSYPNQGVGLLRMEFIINNSVQIHPMALVKYDELIDGPDKSKIDVLTRHYKDKKQFFIDTLAESIALVAAAFYPKDVIVRMSDFKSNEYAKLLGGKPFEPEEENPMLGFRGASRYYNERYRDGFALECAAIKKLRDDMGLVNVKVMIPFCRTIKEGEKVLEEMKKHGLIQGQNKLEVYVMAEIPSNIILAKEFAELFDGFSIGSNDLTQLTLGLDRDSAIISDLFDENNEAIKTQIKHLIETAKNAGVKVGLCGQAPSDYPEYTKFLVECGIDSISFNPDAMIRGIENIMIAEHL